MSDLTGLVQGMTALQTKWHNRERDMTGWFAAITPTFEVTNINGVKTALVTPFEINKIALATSTALSQMTDVSSTVTSIEARVTAITPAITDFENKYTTFGLNYADIQTKYPLMMQAAIDSLSNADKAKISETNAKESEANALSHKNASALSEANAKNSETASSTHKNASALSETNAHNSETSASLSETKAKASEINSKASELASLENKNASALSATNSKASETASSTSEINAKTSETNAKNSELASIENKDASKLSETNSKASETAASTSEINAKTSETNAKNSELASLENKSASALSATNAKASETAASLSEGKAKNSETNSKASETKTATENTQAQAAKTLAQQYANHPEDIFIPGTSEYSAKHYKNKTVSLASGTAPDSLRLNGQLPSYYFSALDGGTISNNVTIDNGENTTLTIKSNDSGMSKIELLGDDQGTGQIFVGQSAEYGGGIEYNGDNNPSTTGAGVDQITLFRRSNSVNHWTARNFHAGNDWQFRGKIFALEDKEVYHEGNLTPAVIGALPTDGTGIIRKNSNGDILRLEAFPVTEHDISLFMGISTGNSYRLTYHGTGTGNNNDISLSSSIKTLFRSHQNGIVNFPEGLKLKDKTVATQETVDSLANKIDDIEALALIGL